MGEINRAEALQLLQQQNPAVDLGMLSQYVDQFAAYVEAQENISRNGAVCAHPRTGAPMENPYLKVRDNATRLLQKMRRVKNTAELWRTYAGDKTPDGANDETRNPGELDSARQSNRSARANRTDKDRGRSGADSPKRRNRG